MSNYWVGVCGIGCSGTSAISGIVHKLGCPMYLPGHSWEREQDGVGYYEDTCFHGLFAVRPTPGLLERARRLVAQHRQEPRWGVKETMLGRSLPWFLPIVQSFGDTPMVLTVHRTLVASIYGRMRGRCTVPMGKRYSWTDASRWAVRAKLEMLEGVATAEDRGVDVYHVSFEHLIAEPEKHIGLIATWLGLDVTDDALAHVRPGLKHY